jgi:hypothetical protein
MRIVLLLLLVACQKTPEKAKFTAACKPDASSYDFVECTVENIGKVKGRACVTSREQVPNSVPLVAQRVCTKELAPGEKVTFRPKYDRLGKQRLQAVCAPQGQWVCRDEIVETPEMLTENLPSMK